MLHPAMQVTIACDINRRRSIYGDTNGKTRVSLYESDESIDILIIVTFDRNEAVRIVICLAYGASKWFGGVLMKDGLIVEAHKLIEVMSCKMLADCPD